MASVSVPPLIVPAVLVQLQVGRVGQGIAQDHAVGRAAPVALLTVIMKLAVSVEFTVPLPVSVTLRLGASTVSVADPLAAEPLVGVAVAVLFSVAL